MIVLAMIVGGIAGLVIALRSTRFTPKGSDLEVTGWDFVRGKLWRYEKWLRAQRANWRTFQNLSWSMQRLHSDMSTMSTHVQNLREVTGDAYARSRNKESQPEQIDRLMKRVIQLEREVRSLTAISHHHPEEP